MKTQLSIHTITDPVIDKHIYNLKNDIGDFCKVQAAADAVTQAGISKSYFTIQVHAFIHSSVQTCIDAVRSRLLNLAGIINANEAQQHADAENVIIKNKITDLEHEQARLKTKRDALPVNHSKRKNAPWLIAFAVAIAILDGIIALGNFASGGYPLSLSLLGAVVISTLIACAHKAYGPWIKKASTSDKKIQRALIAFGLIFIICTVFGAFRSASVNNTIDVAIQSSEIDTQGTSEVSGWVIAAISFLSFVVCYFLSTLFTKTPEEAKAEAEYNKLTKELEEITGQKQALSKEKKENAAVPVQMKQEERFKYNLWQTSLAQCNSIATGGIIKYRQIYTRHNPVIPDFFNDDISFHFNDSIDFTPTKS